jgi:hypothetical protein
MKEDIRMNVQFETNNLERIEALSFYDHNYYNLPYSIEGNKVVYEEYDEGSNSYEYHLGNIEEGKFIRNLSFWGDNEGNVDLVKNLL